MHRLQRRPGRNRLSVARGFSLMELLVALTIVGILASITYPSYTSYTQRGYSGGATSKLSYLASQMELYFQDNRSYVGAGTTCGKSGANIYIPSGGTTYGDAANYTFTCTGTSTTFTITATGSGAATGYVYTIDEQGNRKTTQYGGTSYSDKSCWMIKDSSC